MSAKFLWFLVKRFHEYCRGYMIFVETEPVLCSSAGKAQTFGSWSSFKYEEISVYSE